MRQGIYANPADKPRPEESFKGIKVLPAKFCPKGEAWFLPPRGNRQVVKIVGLSEASHANPPRKPGKRRSRRGR